MNINRHNYEAFFLLYVDNELSASERNAVQLYVQQNPDLGKELQLLQQSIVHVDKISFEDKTSLLKEDTFASMQEKLLLFTDDELPLAERKQIEVLLSSDAAIAEWNILQQTKLQPDNAIVFPDKASLFRTEGERVVGIKWRPVAAAVLLLGLGIWGGVAFFKNNPSPTKNGGQLANSNKTKPGQNTIPNHTTVIPAPVNQISKEEIAPKTVTTPLLQKESIQSLADKNDQPVEKMIKQKNER